MTPVVMQCVRVNRFGQNKSVQVGRLTRLRRGRDSNSWNPNQVRRFSKPVVSATHPPLLGGSAYGTRTRVPGVRGRYPNR